MLHELIKAFTILAVMLGIFYFAMADARHKKAGVYYDCSLASFHPDVPPRVKEACRIRQTYDQDSAGIAEQQKRHPKYDSIKR